MWSMRRPGGMMNLNDFQRLRQSGTYGQTVLLRNWKSRHQYCGSRFQLVETVSLILCRASPEINPKYKICPQNQPSRMHVPCQLPHEGVLTVWLQSIDISIYITDNKNTYEYKYEYVVPWICPTCTYMVEKNQARCHVISGKFFEVYTPFSILMI